MKRAFFTTYHDIFRDSVKRFVAEELVPHHADWEMAQRVPRDVWRLGRAG